MWVFLVAISSIYPGRYTSRVLFSNWIRCVIRRSQMKDKWMTKPWNFVALRTSNRKKSREFSQKRFIGTECTRWMHQVEGANWLHEVHLHQVERANATEICANEPSAFNWWPRFVQMNRVHQLPINLFWENSRDSFFWLEVRMVLYEIVLQNLEIVLCTWFNKYQKIGDLLRRFWTAFMFNNLSFKHKSKYCSSRHAKTQLTTFFLQNYSYNSLISHWKQTNFIQPFWCSG